MSLVKALFGHDTEQALLGVAALVNTAPSPGDNTDGSGERLPDIAALDRFVEEWGWSGSRRHDDGELVEVRALRPEIRRFWDGSVDEVAAQVNDLLLDHGALPQLVRHDGWPWHVHAAPRQAPLADRMAVEAAMAIIDVVRQDELGRLKVCAAERCGAVLVDLSRNASKRYCSTTCANRVNVAAYRLRRGTGGGGGGTRRP